MCIKRLDFRLYLHKIHFDKIMTDDYNIYTYIELMNIYRHHITENN